MDVTTRPSSPPRDADSASSPARRRPPRGWVGWDPAPEERDAVVDWSPWYLTDEDDMGESGEQNVIIRVLLSVLAVLAEERGWTRTLVGSDQFFAWVEQEPLVRVSPDVYLLDDPPSPPLPDSWATWLPGIGPPRFALEVVSRKEWRKDYEGNPPKYSQLGTSELVVFDPWAGTSGAGKAERLPLQIFRKTAEGALERVYCGPGPARSEELQAWLVVRSTGGRRVLRVARDAAGSDLVPTEEEDRRAKDQALAAKDQDLAAKDQALAAKDLALAAKDQDLAAKDQDLAEALAELERLRGQRETE